MLFVILSFFLGVIVLLLSNIIGGYILSFYKTTNNLQYKIFLSNILGLITIVLLYAIVKANFKTILLLLIPFIIILFTKVRKYRLPVQHFSFKFVLQSFLYSIALYSIVFIFQLIPVFDFNKIELKTFFGDTYLYANFSDNLYLFGSENTSLQMNSFFDSNKNYLIPYHYPELWLTAFSKQIINLPSVIIYYFVSVSILISVLWIGIISLIQKSFKNRGILILVSFILLFTTLVFDPFFNKIETVPFLSETSIMGVFHHKLGFIFILVLLSFSIFKEFKELSILILFVLPVFSISFLPGIYGGIAFYYTVIWFRRKFKIEKRILEEIIILIFALISFYFFYIYFKSPVSSKTMHGAGIPLFKRISCYFPDNSSLKVNIINFFIYGIPSVFFYVKGVIGKLILGTLFFIPFVLLLAKTFFQNSKLFYLICAILFTGLFTVLLTDGILDNYQFYSNLTLLFSVFLIYLFSRSKNTHFKIFFLCTVCVFCLIPIIKSKFLYSHEAIWSIYSSDIFKEFPLKDEKINILYYANQNDFKGKRFNSWVANNNLISLSANTNKTLIFTIANPQVYLNKNVLTPQDKVYYDLNNPIILWSKNKNKENDLIGFINHYKIKYIYSNSDIDKDILCRLDVFKILNFKNIQSKMYILR